MSTELDEIRSIPVEILQRFVEEAFVALGTPPDEARICAEVLVASAALTGKKDGMQLLDQHILEYMMSGVISNEEAYMKSNNKSAFRQYLQEKPPEEFT